MKSYEAFNRSSLSRFLNTPAGRIFRVVLGTAFIVAGLIFRYHTLGIVSIAWGLLPLSAGAFDVCWVSAALGGPLRGEKIREIQRGTK